MSMSDSANENWTWLYLHLSRGATINQQQINYQMNWSLFFIIMSPIRFPNSQNFSFSILNILQFWQFFMRADLSCYVTEQTSNGIIIHLFAHFLVLSIKIMFLFLHEWMAIRGQIFFHLIRLIEIIISTIIVIKMICCSSKPEYKKGSIKLRSIR